MTEHETQVLYEALERNAPSYLDRLKRKYQKKKDMIMTCFDIATNGADHIYQDDINRLYNTCRSLMNETETYMLNYICLIRHKEQVNEGIRKDDEDIIRWVKYLQDFRDSVSNGESNDSIIWVLDREARKISNRFKTNKPVGRPKGKGKKVFQYNGKDYQTIQECANDYGISKQGMHKRLKKLQII